MSSLSCGLEENPPQQTFTIREAQESDAPALFQVCLETGDYGSDATRLYIKDPDALGRRWVGPYLQGPELAFAHSLENEATGKVVGYCLATLDTVDFTARIRNGYLSELKADERFAVRPTVPSSEWTPEEAVYSEYHAHPDSPASVVAKYPSHLHIDMTAEAQGRGNGSRMMASLLGKLRAAGSPGVHLEMHWLNDRARRFYERLGFHEVARVVDEAPGRRRLVSGDVHSATPAEAAAAAKLVADGTPHIVFMALAFKTPDGQSGQVW